MINFVTFEDWIVVPDDDGREIASVHVTRGRVRAFRGSELIGSFSGTIDATRELERLLAPDPEDPETPEESVDGLRVFPGGDPIFDSLGDRWALDASGNVLRNGLNFNAGQASTLLYLSLTVYAQRISDGHWISWDGSAPWNDEGVGDPEAPPDSPNGTIVPDDEDRVFFDGSEWTIEGPFNLSSFRNGAQYKDGGWVEKIKLQDDVLYFLQPADHKWYEDLNYADPDAVAAWDATEWGTTEPGTTPPPPEDPPPPLPSPFVTTGSTTAGSAWVLVAEIAKFAVNDYAIVEIGAEPVFNGRAGGQRGTKGVGGQWPALSYPDFTAMNAAVGVGMNTYAWREDNGDVYRKQSNGWQPNHPSVYYFSKAVPHALQGQVAELDVPGSRIRLTGGPTNGIAQLPVSDANVYNDKGPFLNAHSAALGSNVETNLQTLLGGLPNGTSVPIGCALKTHNKTGPRFTCNSRGSIELFSPKGVPSLQWEIYNCQQPQFKWFSMRGNFSGDHGFGLNRRTVGSAGAGNFDQPVTETVWQIPGNVPRQFYFVLCPGLTNRSINMCYQMDSYEAGQFAFGADSCQYSVIRECVSDHTTYLREYVQWMITQVWGYYSQIIDCRIDCAEGIIAGIELFHCRYSDVIRPMGKNMEMASNNSGGGYWGADPADTSPTAPGGELRYTANCAEAQVAHPTATAQLSLIALNINKNANPGVDYAILGNIARNLRIISEGYATSAANPTARKKFQMPGIAVQAPCPNTTIDGLYLQGLDADPAYAGSNGAVGVVHTAQSPVVRNTTVIGKSREVGEDFNLYVLNGWPGVMTNNVAQRTRPPWN